MKSKFTTLLIISLISLSANAAEKLAFINPAVLMEKSPQAIDAANKMKDEFMINRKK